KVSYGSGMQQYRSTGLDRRLSPLPRSGFLLLMGIRVPWTSSFDLEARWKMDTRRLKFYCTIVEQGQISRAAKILNISQPPLSRCLNELEEELGVELINRKGQSWQVTEAGRVLYERARQGLNLFTEIPTEVRHAAEGHTGRILVGLSISFISYF